MSIHSPHRFLDRQGDIPVTRPPDLRDLTAVELDLHIREAWDFWCDLLENLLRTEVVLPSRDLAGRMVRFFENRCSLAEDARVEALRLQASAHNSRRNRGADQSSRFR